jgi:hypothetical protein
MQGLPYAGILRFTLAYVVLQANVPAILWKIFYIIPSAPQTVISELEHELRVRVSLSEYVISHLWLTNFPLSQHIRLINDVGYQVALV